MVETRWVHDYYYISPLTPSSPSCSPWHSYPSQSRSAPSHCAGSTFFFLAPSHAHHISSMCVPYEYLNNTPLPLLSHAHTYYYYYHHRHHRRHHYYDHLYSSSVCISMWVCACCAACSCIYTLFHCIWFENSSGACCAAMAQPIGFHFMPFYSTQRWYLASLFFSSSLSLFRSAVHHSDGAKRWPANVANAGTKQ